jgi:hypothetical protein
MQCVHSKRTHTYVDTYINLPQTSPLPFCRASVIFIDTKDFTIDKHLKDWNDFETVVKKSLSMCFCRSHPTLESNKRAFYFITSVFQFEIDARIYIGTYYRVAIVFLVQYTKMLKNTK